MTRSEKGALGSMLVFSVLLIMEYTDKCINATHGITPTTVVAVVLLISSGILFVLGGRGRPLM